MAACPVVASNSHVTSVCFGRRRLALTQRRLAANRRNAARSTGPRTIEGKARVARNAVKHGFFAATQRWRPEQHRDYAELIEGLRNDFQPQTSAEDGCVATMAESLIRMAAVMRYESLAALKYHRRKDSEIDARIAVAATPQEAARLGVPRENLRRAGLWQPSMPSPREADSIFRWIGNLDRRIARAASTLRGLQSMRRGGFAIEKTQKQTHFAASPRSNPEALPKTSNSAMAKVEAQKQSHFGAVVRAASTEHENEKTNPLSSMFTGNRDERRRAKALARRHPTDA